MQYTLEQGFTSYRVGYAFAASVIFLALVAAVALARMWLLRNREEDGRRPPPRRRRAPGPATPGHPARSCSPSVPGTAVSAVLPAPHARALFTSPESQTEAVEAPTHRLPEDWTGQAWKALSETGE